MTPNQYRAPFETKYRHDRRSHRHRCRCCSKIINAGEPVIMARVNGSKMWALHEECGDRRHSKQYSWREVFAEWAAK